MSDSNHSWAGISFEDLTNPQKDFLKLILQNSDKSFFLKGCAGSGKTVIATHALSLLKKNAQKSVGFLVYTKLLRKFIEDGFQGDGIADEIFHFHDWYYHGRPTKDIFLIDECQDFKPDWIDAVKASSTCQVWLGDDSQQIYDDPTGFEKLSKEFTDSSITKLDVNYRNSLFVARFASNFIRLTSSDKSTGITHQHKVDSFIKPILSNPLQASGANNQPVVFIEATQRSKEFDAVARIIKDIESNTLEQSRKIAVAHFSQAMLDRIQVELEDRGIDVNRKHKDDDETGFPDFKKSFFVLLSPIHSLKGLEADYIIFPSTDEDKWRDELIFNNLLFVLFTRARKRIYCSYSNRSNSYVYQAVSANRDGDFYQIVSADEILGTGNPVKPNEEIEEIIRKHFDEFNI